MSLFVLLCNRKIVKDPYEKLMEGSDDKVKDITPKNR